MARDILQANIQFVNIIYSLVWSFKDQIIESSLIFLGYLAKGPWTRYKHQEYRQGGWNKEQEVEIRDKRLETKGRGIKEGEV